MTEATFGNPRRRKERAVRRKKDFINAFLWRNEGEGWQKENLRMETRQRPGEATNLKATTVWNHRRKKRDWGLSGPG